MNPTTEYEAICLTRERLENNAFLSSFIPEQDNTGKPRGLLVRIGGRFLRFPSTSLPARTVEQL